MFVDNVFFVCFFLPAEQIHYYFSGPYHYNNTTKNLTDRTRDINEPLGCGARPGAPEPPSPAEPPSVASTTAVTVQCWSLLVSCWCSGCTAQHQWWPLCPVSSESLGQCHACQWASRTGPVWPAAPGAWPGPVWPVPVARWPCGTPLARCTVRPAGQLE